MCSVILLNNRVFKTCVYNCYHIFGYQNNNNKNPKIFMIFPSWNLGHQKYSLIKSIIFSLYNCYIHLPSPWYLGIIPSILIQVNPSTYQGSFIKDPPNYKSLSFILYVWGHTYIQGGESVMVCKGGGYDFYFWLHVMGDCLTVMWFMTSLPVFVMSLLAHEFQILYKPSEFVYWLRAVLTWHLKASHLAPHR